MHLRFPFAALLTGMRRGHRVTFKTGARPYASLASHLWGGVREWALPYLSWDAAFRTRRCLTSLKVNLFRVPYQPFRA
jgi:hypothetical protein